MLRPEDWLVSCFLLLVGWFSSLVGWFIDWLDDGLIVGFGGWLVG